jgi:hypothetical protein
MENQPPKTQRYVNILSNHGQSVRGNSPPYWLSGKGGSNHLLWEIDILRNAVTNFGLVIIL